MRCCVILFCRRRHRRGGVAVANRPLVPFVLAALRGTGQHVSLKLLFIYLSARAGGFVIGALRHGSDKGYGAMRPQKAPGMTFFELKKAMISCLQLRVMESSPRSRLRRPGGLP